MIVWAIGGLFVGWVLSSRLRVVSLGAFLLSSVALPVAVFVVLRRFDIEAVWGFAVFWVAVQSTYLIGNLLTTPVAAATDRPRFERT